MRETIGSISQATDVVASSVTTLNGNLSDMTKQAKKLSDESAQIESASLSIDEGAQGLASMTEQFRTEKRLIA